MTRFGYYGMRLAAFCCAVVPFRMLYVLSDAMRFFFLRVIRYRYKVVLENLQQSFPEKSDREIQLIIKTFYKILCDNILETLKGLTMRAEQFCRRYRFVGIDLLEREFAQGQSVLLAGGHFNNWEWGVFSVSLWLQHRVVGVYKPIRNPLIDAYYKQQRERFGLHLASMKQAGRAIAQYRQQPCAFVFIADQAPSDVNNCHWVDFLHRETAFLQGVDKIARSTGYPVYYFDIKRLKRGFYESTFSELVREPAKLPEAKVTELLAKRLEQSIRERPADWLWSHKRWKRQKPENLK